MCIYLICANLELSIVTTNVRFSRVPETQTIMKYEDKWEEELGILKGIFSKLPLEKTVKWGADVFTYEGKNIVSCYGFKDYFTIFFYNGVFLTDPYKVLINAQEGKTKTLRHWRFNSQAEISEEKIIAYVNEAIEIAKKGLTVKPEKFKALPIPELLEKEFNQNSELKSCFDKLTPGKQKEYIVYLNEPKQEKTKLSRLEKIKPVIIVGKGLNDKYKK